MNGIDISIWAGGSAGGGSNMALLVAASDAPAVYKAAANYVCDGSADDVQINAAILALHPLAASLGGVVLLSPGKFYIKDPINMKGGMRLQGSGMKATLLSLEAGLPRDMIQFTTPYSVVGTATSGSTTTLLDSTKSWTTDAWKGKSVRVKSGYGTGLRGTVVSNSASGLTVTSWTAPLRTGETAPNSTSQYVLGEASDLFQSYNLFTTAGAYLSSPAITGSITASGTVTLTDSAKNWTVNQFNGQVSVEILTCTGVPTAVGQIRRIMSNTADTLTLSDEWQYPPDTSATYVIRGHGIACYGMGSYDVDITDVWTSYHSGHGVYIENTWGHTGKFISEYNGGDGVRCEVNPADAFALAPMEGPKYVNCKFVRNAGSGYRSGKYVYSAQLSNVEAGAGDAGHAGIWVRGGNGHLLTSCKIASHGNQTVVEAAARAGIKFGDTTDSSVAVTSSVINGCYFRSTSSGMLPYAIDMSGSSNATIGCAFYVKSTDRAYYDRDGRNTIESCVYGDNKTLTKTAGTITKQSTDTSTITFNPGLGTPVPSSCVVVVNAIPANDAARAGGPWSVVSSAYNAVVLKSTGTLAGSTDFTFHVTCEFQDRSKVPA